MNRQEYNFKILMILQTYLTQNPDIRFGQALSNLNIATHKKNSDEKWDDVAGYKDIFYEEPETTLQNLRNI